MRIGKILLALTAFFSEGLFNHCLYAGDPKLVDATELAEIFSTLCIQDFPDPVLTEEFIQSKGATAMSPKDVMAYLHNDPGRGWFLKTEVALYAITFEEPPFHTCAIRRMTPDGESGPGQKLFADMVKAYATKSGAKLVGIKPGRTESPNGLEIFYSGSGVVDAAGKNTDSFGVFLSNYHGNAPGLFKADAGDGKGIEVRFSHQVIGR